MSCPPRTRSAFKSAGRALAVESVDAIAGQFANLTQAELDDPVHIDAVTERLLESAVEVARGYLASGSPAVLVRAFLSAFRRTAVLRLAEYVRAVRPAANDA